MGLKKRILLASAEKVRNEVVELKTELERFDRNHPKWQFREARKSKLRRKIEQKEQVLAELRIYLNSDVAQ
jgi:ribosomal protein L32E